MSTAYYFTLLIGMVVLPCLVGSVLYWAMVLLFRKVKS
jgi:hypothetical protein